MTTFFSVLTALANIRIIGGYIDTFAGAVTLWYIKRQKRDTLGLIADAAAFLASAKTNEERYQSSELWRKALSRPRF